MSDKSLGNFLAYYCTRCDGGPVNHFPTPDDALNALTTFLENHTTDECDRMLIEYKMSCEKAKNRVQSTGTWQQAPPYDINDNLLL